MTAIVVVASVLALSSSSAADAQRASSAGTPQDCVKAGREFATSRQKQAGELTGDILRQIDAQRVEIVRACAAAFDVEKAQGRDLVGLVELYAETGQPELAERALARAMAPGALADGDRPDLLGNAIRFLLRQSASAERNARAEGYVDMLDALPDSALEQKITAHSSLNGYYRGDDIDAGIIRHSTWLIEIAPRLTPDQRKRYGSALIAAYVNLAEALAGQGENDRTVELLRRAPVDLSDLPQADRRTKDTLARYLLVGTPAAPVTASVWLNAPAGTRSMEVKEDVTLLEFTAHWCGPCRESYPGIQRLRHRFAGRGFRVVLATQLYGRFDKERDLTPEQEIARDRTYFAGHGLDVPIAIAASGMTTVDGKPTYRPPENDVAYKVGGIPQINIIDARGILRLIMVGYDDANEERLASFIEKLLAERSKPTSAASRTR